LNTTSCGDWIAYKEEKCIKALIDRDLQTYDNAKQICVSQESGDPSLIQINSLEEQQFVEKLLFDTNKMFEFVWLGARLDTKSHHYHWDGSTKQISNYQNWAQLKNNTDYECVEMIPDGNDRGKWVNTSCKKKNIAVCQRMQNWGLDRLQKEFLNLKLDHEFKISKLNSNLMPIGFIYVHLPKEKSPTKIWPSMRWTDVSSSYANVFFRVVGSDTSAFGQVQNENAPRLGQVDTIWDYDAAVWAEASKHRGVGDSNATIPITGRSDWVYTGKDSSTNHGRWMSLKLTTGEVRPRNMAIRIWQRTG